MNRLFICLLVLLSFVAAPVLAGNCVDARYSITETGNHDTLSKQQPGADGNLGKGIIHCCVCVHAIGLPDRITLHTTFITKTVFLAAQDVFAPDYNPSPLLEPPSHV